MNWELALPVLAVVGLAVGGLWIMVISRRSTRDEGGSRWRYRDR